MRLPGATTNWPYHSSLSHRDLESLDRQLSAHERSLANIKSKNRANLKFFDKFHYCQCVRPIPFLDQRFCRGHLQSKFASSFANLPYSGPRLAVTIVADRALDFSGTPKPNALAHAAPMAPGAGTCRAQLLGQARQSKILDISVLETSRDS